MDDENSTQNVFCLTETQPRTADTQSMYASQQEVLDLQAQLRELQAELFHVTLPAGELQKLVEGVDLRRYEAQVRAKQLEGEIDEAKAAMSPDRLRLMELILKHGSIL